MTQADYFVSRAVSTVAFFVLFQYTSVVPMVIFILFRHVCVIFWLVGMGGEVRPIFQR